MQLRVRLEEDMCRSLQEYRAFIDEEMIVILRQMDSPSQIFDHLYLGSEWNASNLEELRNNRWVGKRFRGDLFIDKICTFLSVVIPDCGTEQKAPITNITYSKTQ